MKIRLSEDKANRAMRCGWRFLSGAILAMALILVFTVAEREHYPRLSSRARAQGRILLSFPASHRQARKPVAGNRSGRPLPIYDRGLEPDRSGKRCILVCIQNWRYCSISLLFWQLLATLFSPIPASADGGAPQLAYVAGGSHGVSVIDIAQQKVTNSFSLDGDPHTVLLSLDGRFLYVTQPALGRVAMLAAKTGQTICTASVPGQPTLLAFDPGTNVLYAAGNGAASISAIDATNCAVRHTFKTAGPVYGLAVAVVGAGISGGNDNQLWVANGTDITVFNSAGQQLFSIPIPGGPEYLCIPPGITVYATTRQGTVVAVDVGTKRVWSPPLLTNGKFGPMDYDANTGEVYVPDQQNNQLDILTPILPGASTVPHEPGRTIHMEVTPQSIAITSDGQLGFVALASGYVLMLDIPGRQTVNTIYVGGTPHFIITGLYPPLVGTTPQEASTWSTIFNILAYVLVVVLLLVPTLLIWRYRARQGQSDKSD